MRLAKYLMPLLGSAAFFAGGIQGAQAALFASAVELPKYLVIAIGDDDGSGAKFKSFDMADTELGADQEVVSDSDVGDAPQRVGGSSLGYNGGLNLDSIFVATDGAAAAFGGNRWNDTDPDHPGDAIPNPDRLPGARPIFEGIDFRGNVAIAGLNAEFDADDTDTNATFGIRCQTAGCNGSGSAGAADNSYYSGSAGDPRLDLGTASLTAGGVSTFAPADLTALNLELTATRDFIVGMAADTIFSAATFASVVASERTFWDNTTGEGATFGTALGSLLTGRNIRDSGAVVMTDLDAIDTNNDGFAVIDIDVGGGAFTLLNTDWILKSVEETIAVFRLTGNADQFNFYNSSILLGDGVNTRVIDEIGAIFFSDAIKDTNEVFALSNVILGGVALWDFIDYNPRGVITPVVGPDIPATRLYNAPGDGVGSVKVARPGNLTLLNLSNSQGCGQFIGHEIAMSNNRWSGCTQVAMVPEPSTWLIIGLGAIGIEISRRSRRVMRRAAA